MNAGIVTYYRHYSRNPPCDDFLWIRLSRIDYVVNSDSATKVRTLESGFCFGVRITRRNPKQLTILILAKELVVKVETQLPQFPELIGDVFSGVGYSPIRTDNDFV